MGIFINILLFIVLLVVILFVIILIGIYYFDWDDKLEVRLERMKNKKIDCTNTERPKNGKNRRRVISKFGRGDSVSKKRKNAKW